MSNLGKQPAIILTVQGVFDASEAGERPVPANFEPVKGVFVGGCVAVGISRLNTSRTRGHAHTHPKDEHYGWICFALPEYWDDPQYEALRMHELAHIIAGHVGHRKKWRDVMHQLGQEVPAYYLRRVKA